VTTDEAVEAWRQARAAMEAAGVAQAPGDLSSEALLARNLVGGVISAQAWPD
jgi:hypothetical protein